MNHDYKVKEYGIGSIFDEDEAVLVKKILLEADTLSFGPYRTNFELDFAKYCGVKYAVSTTSATAALTLANQILGLANGDEIIGTPQTFKATYMNALRRGVKIKFADVEPDTLNIDPNTIEPLITSRTKAIYVMDYGGNPVDMDAIRQIADKYHLYIVEDAAHAIGAAYKGRKVGSNADITCFSFHSLKNITTFGEGGMLTTDNGEFMEKARNLREIGIVGNSITRQSHAIGGYEPLKSAIYDHSEQSFTNDYTDIEEWGNNFRMNELQAAVGSSQLKKLDRLNRKRKEIADLYSKRMEEIEGVRGVRVDKDNECSWHLYPCFVDPSVIECSRDEVLYYLESNEIQIVQRFFPIHLTDYMRYYGHKWGESPVCERVWFDEQINLPINPRMAESDVNYVITALKDAIRHATK